MEPVEINAGAWYLRALRVDDRIDDGPALAEMGEADAGYVAKRAAEWSSDRLYTWAVCEPTTGEMLAEVTLNPTTKLIDVRVRSGHADVARAGADTVRRFADTLP